MDEEILLFSDDGEVEDIDEEDDDEDELDEDKDEDEDEDKDDLGDEEEELV